MQTLNVHTPNKISYRIQLFLAITFVTLCFKSDLSVTFSCIFVSFVCIICFDEVFVRKKECICQSVETKIAVTVSATRSLDFSGILWGFPNELEMSLLSARPARQTDSYTARCMERR